MPELRRGVAAAVCLAVLLVAAGCVAPSAQRSLSGPDAPADPSSDRLGWEGGYWHNESLAITTADGLNRTERRAVVDRAMARVEVIREMEFGESVPVEVESRETFRERFTDGGADGGDGGGERPVTLADTSFEAMFLVGESTSGAERESETTASSVIGYYLPGDDRIVLISERAAPDVRESTLAHELVHALQFRHFETAYNGSTREARNARNGVVEGEARLVDYRYRQRCGEEWNCVVPPTRGGDGDAGGDGGGNGGGDAPAVHPGIAILNYFPYSDGPVFVREQYRAGGWDAVAALHDDLPASTEQVIEPAKYGVDAPTHVTVPDRSGPDWERVGEDGSPGEVLGMPGITAMFAYTAYDEANRSSVIAPTDFLTMSPGLDPIDYGSAYASGWDGDRVRAYERDGEAGYVWRLTWDSPTEAAEFARGYRHLLAHWGGARVDGHTGVWRIDDGRFADAFRLTVEGETVTVVNAPTVDDLDGVHAPAGR